MDSFTARCNACADVAQYVLAADFDTRQNAIVATYTLFCQNCGAQESVSVTVPKPGLLPQDPDPEVVAAIKEVIG